MELIIKPATDEETIEALKNTIERLQQQIKKMKCCENCKYYRPCVTVNETIGNECEDFYNGCNNSVIAPFGKWEIKE